MEYATISEAWNSPLGIQLKKFNDDRRSKLTNGEIITNSNRHTPTSLTANDYQVKLNDDNNQDSIHKNELVLRQQQIIPPSGCRAEPIDKYLEKRKVEPQYSDIGIRGEQTFRDIDFVDPSNTYIDKHDNCDTVFSHLLNCSECYHRYINRDQILPDKSNKKRTQNDYTTYYFDSEFRQTIMLLACGIFIIMLLDLVFKNKQKSN
jgi:hypothetical protein